MTVFLISHKANASDGSELRYMLRSLEKNWVGEIDRIHIAGDLPTWIRDVTNTPNVTTHDGLKVRNIAANVLEGSRVLADDGVDEAIYLDDDYFLMYPQREVLPTHWGSLSDHTRLARRGNAPWWADGFAATQEILDSAGRIASAQSYELHAPFPFEPRSAATVLRNLNQRPRPGFWRSLYGNLIGWPGRRSLEAIDGRFYGSTYPFGVPWVSTEDLTWQERLGERVRERLPQPSRWES